MVTQDTRGGPIPERGELLGRGREAEVYAWGAGCVLKLFHEDTPRAHIMHEADVTRRVHDKGLPTPDVVEVVQVDGRRGIVLERVEGPTMIDQLAAAPWRIVPLGRTLAELHAAMHSRRAPDLPSRRETLARSIAAVDMLGEARVRGALRRLEDLPDGDAILHGDYHPDNVLMAARGPMIIDGIAGERDQLMALVDRGLSAHG